jgi:hypothetical protein
MATMRRRDRIGQLGFGVFLMMAVAVFFAAASTQAQAVEPPFRWAPPATFNPNTPGLGLPSLPGLKTTTLFTPKPSNAAVDTGGSGQYEGVQYGTFNHSATLALYQDKVIVYWYNHDQDEDAPGQRILAKVGTFNADRTDINWGGNETLVELAGPSGLVRRKSLTSDPNVITEAATNGDLQIINGRIYVMARLGAADGWSNDPAYGTWVTAPVPASKWSDVKTSSYRYDVYHDLGRTVQQWDIQGSTLHPVSPVYKTEDFVQQVEVTPGRFKQVPSPLAPYTGALPFASSPAMIQSDIVDGTPESFLRYPNYAAGTWNLTTDGTNGLAHYTEFQRPDGTWVVVRDNLVNPTHYYAADKANLTDFYPSGVETNLFGAAQPTSGELPDGRPWIICNDQSRQDMYMTLSKDGRVFDKTWLLQHNNYVPIEDGIGKTGGAQYFQSVTVGDYIWVVYDIDKESIAVTRVPIQSLPEPSAVVMLATVGLCAFGRLSIGYWRRRRP